MCRRALLTSLLPLALAGLAGPVAFALGPEMTARLATQLGQSAFDTNRGVASYLGRTTSLSAALFATLAWVAAEGFHAFIVHHDPSGTRMTAKHTFALVASAVIPLVAIFARDRLVVVAGMGIALLAGAGVVFAGRLNARDVVTGPLHAVAPVAGGGVVVSLVAGPAVARTTTLALPLAVDYVLGIVNARGWLRLGATIPALASAVSAWTHFPSAVGAAGFDPEAVGLALDSAVAAALLSLPFMAIGYAITCITDAKRQAGANPTVSTVE